MTSTNTAARHRAVHLRDARQFAGMKEMFEADNPGLRLTLVRVEREAALRSESGGMRVFWIFEGAGAVLIPKGFRTQEGDGEPLPPDYRPDPISPDFAAQLQTLKAGAPTITAAAYGAVGAILRKWKKDRHAFIGDFAGELWRLDHLPRPWSTDAEVEKVLQSLFTAYREPGFSTKQSDAYERLMPGDQLIAHGGKELRARGHFTCLAMEHTRRKSSHVPAVRRLRHLADTAGGCNPDFDPFRRLPLTWFYNYPGETGDGLNWVNSHVVNIPKETSPSHFHPPKAIGGGGSLPQREMYLVLDPAAYQLNPWGRTAALLLWPDLRNLGRCERILLEPGMFVYIPPGTGHRGLDVFVNVLTLPGFKPWNEYYIDREIRDTGGGQSPFNENLVGSRNYERIEELL